MFAGKPIIGIVGGIGSGKSFVAGIFAEFGCLVISSDEQVKQAYRDPAIRQTLRSWWGDETIRADREIDKSAIARKVFADPQQRLRLEQLLHPWVDQARQAVMEQHRDDAQVLAFVWDTPLLIEVGLHDQCDAVVFVDSPGDLRLSRVQQARGWDAAQLQSREKSQMPLDKKREIADHVISNSASANEVRVQVRDVLSRIFAGTTPTTTVSD